MNQSASFNFGFASNMTLLLWCVCGGFLLHMLECNFLTILIKPNYEKPVDTAADVLSDASLTIIWFPDYEYYREMAINQNQDTVFRDLAKKTYVAKVSYILYFTLPFNNE